MRASRAYIAGFGTTSVLVGATLLLFLVVTALVAFRAWPGSDLTDAVSDLVVKEQQQPSLTVSGPTQVALDAAPAAAAVGAAVPLTPSGGDGEVAGAGPFSGSAPGTPGVATGPGGVVPESVTGVGRGSQPPAGGGPLRQAPGGDPAAGGNPVSGLGGVTNGLGGATQGLTDGLGQTVGGVNPELGKNVTDTGKALSDLVRGLDR